MTSSTTDDFTKLCSDHEITTSPSSSTSVSSTVGKTTFEAISKVKTLSTVEIKELTVKSLERRLIINVEHDHFINKYVRYMSKVTDAYPDYAIMCALWLLSAACQGKVSLKLKQMTLKPNLYIILFGLSTISRKTTAVNKAKQMFEAVTGMTLYHDEYSVEGYLERLQHNPISNFVKDEVVGLLRKYNKRYNEGIYELENAIYDGQPIRKTLAKERGRKREVIVENEYVTHLYATTHHNYASCMSVGDFRSGYGFRFLYCHPQYEKKRMALALEVEDDRRVHSSVLASYLEICKVIEMWGDVEFEADRDALEYLDKFDAELQKKIMELKDDDIAAAWGRNVDHILKICMLIEIGRPIPNYVISLDTMEEACRMTKEYFLPMCIDVIERLQEEEQLNKVEKVTGILKNKGGKCQHSELLKRSKMCSDDFIKVINTLKESEVIEEIAEGGSCAKWYVLTEESAIDKMAL